MHEGLVATLQAATPLVDYFLYGRSTDEDVVALREGRTAL